MLALETKVAHGEEQDNSERDYPLCQGYLQLIAKGRRKIESVDVEDRAIVILISCPDIEGLGTLQRTDNNSLKISVKDFLFHHEDLKNEFGIEDIEMKVELPRNDYDSCFTYHIEKRK